MDERIGEIVNILLVILKINAVVIVFIGQLGIVGGQYIS